MNLTANEKKTKERVILKRDYRHSVDKQKKHVHGVCHLLLAGWQEHST